MWWTALLVLILVSSPAPGRGTSPEGHVAQWTERPHRNMASSARNLPAELGPENELWRVEFPSNRYTFGIPPTVVDGRLLVGGTRRMMQQEGHVRSGPYYGGLLCLDAASGDLIWEIIVKSPGHGLCSAPTVDGDRVYTGGQIVYCLDLDGLTDGNDGSFTDEAQLFKGDGVSPHDPDLLWRYDIRERHDTRPHDGEACTPLVQGDNLWVTTSHAESHHKANLQYRFQKMGWEYVPKDGPRPNMLVLDKNTGELVAKDNVDVIEVYHGQWSSPSMGEVGGRTLVFWGDGHGVVHAFRPPEREPGEVVTLEEVWKVDCNPPQYKRDEEGNHLYYPTWKGGPNGEYPSPGRGKRLPGPNEIIAVPVRHDGKLYVAAGRDHAYGIEHGALFCIDPRGRGDITDTNILWYSTEIGRTSNTPAIADGLLFVGDNAGLFHCFDAETGEKLWQHDIEGWSFYCTPLVADGKVYVGTGRREVFVFKAAREKKLLSRTRLRHEPYAMTAVHGMLVLPTARSLVAYAGPGEPGEEGECRTADARGTSDEKPPGSAEPE